MNRRSKKKLLAGVLGVLLALSAVTAAVAYFTGRFRQWHQRGYGRLVERVDRRDG